MRYNFEKFCKDYKNIENYDKALKDNFKNWECHHRLQTWNSDGERRLVDISAEELQALGMYYNRPAEELIFLTASEHRSLHNKGESNPMYGKHLSDEHKNKIAEAKKGKQAPWAKGNTNTKGKRWFNNGKINIRAKECPDGFVPGIIKIK